MAEFTSVIAAGGLLIRKYKGKTQIALIKRKGGWDLPKGKQEPGESIIACARREVAEELGIAPPTVIRHLGQTWHTYLENDKHFRKTTYWYEMKPAGCNPKFSPQTAEQIEAVQWAELPEAETMVAYENLKSIIRSYIDLLKG